MNKILVGDCLIKLKELEDNSVDSIITDPPYELGFMGKSWDNTGIANNPKMWAECLRVLKPGGYLLSFGGTRTYHRMACAIEDAGFEVRDMIEWVYGSGFPKSLSIGKAVNSLETKEWSAIGKALDNIDRKSIMEVWKSNSNNVKIVETQSLKNQIIVGQDMPSESFVPVNVAENTNQIKYNVIVSIAENSFIEIQAQSTKESTVQKNVGIIITEIKELQNLATIAENSQQKDRAMRSMNIFTAQCDVKEWLKENTEVNHKVDEVLRILRGNKKYSNEEITNVLCAELTDILKLTILSQSNTFQNLDTKSQTDFLSAINVIITEYTAECLISNTVAILKSKAVDKLQGNEREVIGKTQSVQFQEKGYEYKGDAKGSGFANEKYWGFGNDITKGTSEWEGWGTALKPAHEPICMARKPLAEKTVAENCLKYGTGGINIDESRVDSGDSDGLYRKPSTPNKTSVQMNMSQTVGTITDNYLQGRFPANLIHDNSEEVRECFPNESERFFKSCIYQAKASKSERNKGCEELEEKERIDYGGFHSEKGLIENNRNPENRKPTTNNHPTVKPLELMSYLIKMVTPKGGIVLDPFAGSGSTLVAAKQNGYQYIGIEMTEEYIPIIEARLKSENNLFNI